MKINLKNERIKRKFFQRLKNADGCCDSTIGNVEKAILLYEDFTKHDNFVKYCPDRAIAFKNWLVKRQYRGKCISLTTYHTYLRYLRKFFHWLSEQAGYKSKITPDAVAYLKIGEKEERIAPIKINCEVDLRDRALISFTLLSGMRDKAIATLPLGCFDEGSLIINQNPRQGVQTKFAKYIPSTLLRFDEKLVNYVLEWVKHLKSKGFGSQDPLFPRSKTGQGKDNLSFEPASEVKPVFWQGTGRIREIFKQRAKEAGLSYYPPHTFRHLAVNLAVKHCKDGEQMKALSQNFGHEHLATTLSNYGNYPSQKLAEIIKAMDFSGKPTRTIDEKMDELLQEIKKKELDS